MTNMKNVSSIMQKMGIAKFTSKSKIINITLKIALTRLIFESKNRN